MEANKKPVMQYLSQEECKEISSASEHEDNSLLEVRGGFYGSSGSGSGSSPKVYMPVNLRASIC